MINNPFLFFILAFFLQSCGLFHISQCSHHKVEFCSHYQYSYDTNWINREKFADTRPYFSSFDLFNQIGTALVSKLDSSRRDVYTYLNYYNLAYMYKISWADSFYLYHYRSPHIVERCVCDMYDASYTDSFELERPVWKFYKLNDTTYFSTRLVQNQRDSFLHQPQQIIWKRATQNCSRRLGACEQQYNYKFGKKQEVAIVRRLRRSKMPADLFWQITTYQNPKLSSRKIPNFSMDSLIRSFQK